MTASAEVLNYLEQHLDATHIANTKKRLRRAMNFEPGAEMALHILCPHETGFQWNSIVDAFDDMEKMMVNELIQCCSHPNIKSGNLPMIRGNYGVGILPSLFGVKSKFVDFNMPWVTHATDSQIDEILSRGVPDVCADLGGRCIETADFYHEKLSKYPKCKELIRVYHPDLQGPFDVAHLIWGPDIFYAVYDEPEKVHALLKLVTETYIAFLKEMKKHLNDEDGDFHYHWGSLYPGHVMLRDDTAVVLSEEMYKEFAQPYDTQILEAFGSGTIHYCGRADQWVHTMLDTPGLRALNFGQPPNMQFGPNFLAHLQSGRASRNVSVGQYYVDKSEVEGLRDAEYAKGVTFVTSVSEEKEAERLQALLKA